MMLEIKNLEFAIGDKTILSGIDFAVPKGGYVSVIGPNGAGKSSLIKNIARIHKHGQGEIIIDGRPIKSLSQKNLAKLISYVPQAGGWIPPFKVGEFLALSRYPHTVGTFSLTQNDHAAIDQALALTGLKDFYVRPLKTLSGGERQKVFVAAALAQEAGLILLDEPASFLDPKHSAELNDLLAFLNQEKGLTMLTVTHDLNHPLSVNGLILVLAGGRQLFYGTAEELLAQNILESAYRHNFVFFKHPVTGKTAVLAQ